MALAFALTLLAVGISLIYIGWRGLSLQQFWQTLLSGNAPPKGEHA